MSIYVTHPGACRFCFCTELAIVSLYICELHIRIPIVSTTNSAQSGSKYWWQAVTKFCLFKLLSKFIHTLTIYLTTMSVAKAIAPSNGVISKQCQMGCDANGLLQMYQGKITRWRSQLPNIRQTGRKKILQECDCRMTRFPLHTLEHTDPVSLKNMVPGSIFPRKIMNCFHFTQPVQEWNCWYTSSVNK
jgi:hypothetical protein